jgi:hypothetical protein
MEQETLLTKITDFIFGKKYYATIINTRGTDRCEICSFIHRSKADAEAHKRSVEATMSFLYIETISFRSRKQYNK